MFTFFQLPKSNAQLVASLMYNGRSKSKGSVIYQSTVSKFFPGIAVQSRLATSWLTVTTAAVRDPAEKVNMGTEKPSSNNPSFYAKHVCYVDLCSPFQQSKWCRGFWKEKQNLGDQSQRVKKVISIHCVHLSRLFKNINHFSISFLFLFIVAWNYYVNQEKKIYTLIMIIVANRALTMCQALRIVHLHCLMNT